MRKGRPISDKIKKGDRFLNRKGAEFEIVSVNNAKSVEVMFLLTGYKITTQSVHIRSGAVKDPLYPTMYGVGFFGVGKYNSKDFVVIYQKWKNMLARCYDKEYQAKNPTYNGCSVDGEWHNFQNFAAWCESVGFSGESGFDLDKDIKVDGNKVYSSKFCSIVTRLENTEKACCSKRKIVSPSGEVIDLYNVSKFCRENGLSQGHISSVMGGKRGSHKGWTAFIN